jgi:hypothetical protein
VRSYFSYGTGEFVTKCDGYLVVGARMRLRWSKRWPTEIFVKVGAADTYVGRGDL